MRFWWVNQNQTYRQEISGGYLWSPKRKANGHNNPFYDFMREVKPGDIIFSFANAQIIAIGVAKSYSYEAPKPIEFGQTGAYWDEIGWRLDADFHALRLPVKPSEHMGRLTRHLPGKYAPLRPNGFGLQSVYLTVIPESFAAELIDILGSEAHTLIRSARLASMQSSPDSFAVGLAQWEEYVLLQVQTDPSLESTERLALVMARRGQGLFKKRVHQIEKSCRITGVNRLEHLVASHCKPWRDATNHERLDGENGLLLTPNIDQLFDRGFIGFEPDGRLIISPVAHEESLIRMGVDTVKPLNVGPFSSGQRNYLEFHLDNVLLKSRYLDT